MRRLGSTALQAVLICYIVARFTVAANAADSPPSSSPYIPLFSSVITPILSGLFGFVGSVIGANFALTNFKRQRAFDKQLDWYERAAKAIYTLAEKIVVACTFQDDPSTPVEIRKKVWIAVQRAHLQIGRIAQEARFFASAEAIAQMDEIDRFVQKIADKSEAFDPLSLERSVRHDVVEEIYRLAERLNKACSPLIAEGVSHLGLDRTRPRRQQSSEKTAKKISVRRSKSTVSRAEQVDPESGAGRV